MTPDFASASTATLPFSSRDISLIRLQEAIRGSVLAPSHADFEAAAQAWVVNVRHDPALIVLAETAQDVVEAVRFARRHDLPVGVQATGHGAAAPIEGGLLINTSRMRGYSIDPERAIARVEAGVKWSDIVGPLHSYGLAGLNGSTTDVGIVGYTLGGGVGWFARQHGFAADRVIAADLVSAGGELLRVSAQSHPELFWAIRGGQGNFGIVTALEFSLIPLTHFFGGAVFYDLADAPEVFRAYTDWVATLPEEVTSSIAILRFPPIPFLPEPIRGRNLISIRACGPVSSGERLIEPMRKLAPVAMETFGYHPYPAIDIISTDPIDPMPESASSYLLHSLPAEGIDAILELAGADADFPLLMVELRHIDGAARKAPVDDSAANRHDAPWLVFATGVPFAPELQPLLDAANARLGEVLSPMATGATFTNFVQSGEAATERTRRSYAPKVYARLQRIKAQYDPENRFRFNRNIPPAL